MGANFSGQINVQKDFNESVFNFTFQSNQFCTTTSGNAQTVTLKNMVISGCKDANITSTQQTHQVNEIKCRNESTITTQVQNNIMSDFKSKVDQHKKGLNIGLNAQMSKTIQDSVNRISKNIDISNFQSCFNAFAKNQAYEINGLKYQCPPDGHFKLTVDQIIEQHISTNCIQKNNVVTNAIDTIQKQFDSAVTQSNKGLSFTMILIIVIVVVAVVGGVFVLRMVMTRRQGNQMMNYASQMQGYNGPPTMPQGISIPEGLNVPPGAQPVPLAAPIAPPVAKPVQAGTPVAPIAPPWAQKQVVPEATLAPNTGKVPYAKQPVGYPPTDKYQPYNY